MFNIPPMTQALLVANAAVHGLRLLLPARLDDAVVLTFAFIPARYTVADALGWPALVDPVTYQFLHGSLTHLAINMVALLAFGGGVERRVGSWRMLAFAIICGILAAVAHLAANPFSTDPIIGASGAISGLFGGVLRFQARGRPEGRRALGPLIVLWVILTVATGQISMPGTDGAPVAWVAHLGGFAAGLALFGFFERGARDMRI